MNNPWKLATLGLVLTLVTALSTGVTTAYMMRSAAPAQVVPTVAVAPAVVAPVVTPRPVPVVTAVQASPRTYEPATAPVATPVPMAVQRVAAAPIATDCATGGERAIKIAKPGLIGTLAGAGLGAIGGAITNGGSGAGKGALIGGIAGAALGTGYGAYKTKQECGTIFNSTTLGF